MARKAERNHALRGDPRFVALAESGPDLIAETDSSGRYAYVSPNHLELLGHSPEELIGTSPFDLVHPDDLQEVTAHREALQAGQAGRVVCRIRHADGSWRWVEVTGRPFVDANGESRAIFVARDVTDRELLEESEQQLRAILSSLKRTLVVLFDRDGSMVSVFGDLEREESFGLGRGDVIGGDLQGVIRDDQLAGHRERIERVVETGQTVNLEDCFELGGVEVWFDVTLSPIRDATGGVAKVLAVARDVSQRKAMEKALRESEQRFAKAFHASPVPMVISRLGDQRVLDVNPALLALLGIERGAIVGQVGPALSRFITDEDRTRTREQLVSAGQLHDDELAFRRSDGEQRVCLLSAATMELQGDPCVLFTVVDVTERKQIEQERARLAERMQQMEKLESLGLLAGGIAHDFGSLLTRIHGNAQVALAELAESSPLLPLLEEVEAASARGAEFVRELFAVAGRGQAALSTLDLSRVARDTAELLGRSVSERAELRIEAAAQLPIRADAAQLGRVVMNLLTNAAEAAPDAGGVVALRTGVEPVDSEALAGYLLGEELSAGEYAFVEVSDNGRGVDPDSRERIFDPFFTTKTAGRGLGLAAVLGIVRRHGGALRVETRPERESGASFRVIFRLERGPAPEAASEGSTDSDPAGGRILIVDDDPGVRRVVLRMLAFAGLQGVAAESGPAALELLRESPESFRAVVLDAKMPRMGGEEVFRALRELRPDLPVLFATGRSPEEGADLLAGKSRVALLQKPFATASLTDALRSLLG